MACPLWHCISHQHDALAIAANHAWWWAVQCTWWPLASIERLDSWSSWSLMLLASPEGLSERHHDIHQPGDSIVSNSTPGRLHGGTPYSSRKSPPGWDLEQLLGQEPLLPQWPTPGRHPRGVRGPMVLQKSCISQQSDITWSITCALTWCKFTLPFCPAFHPRTFLVYHVHSTRLVQGAVPPRILRGEVSIDNCWLDQSWGGCKHACMPAECMLSGQSPRSPAMVAPSCHLQGKLLDCQSVIKLVVMAHAYWALPVMILASSALQRA